MFVCRVTAKAWVMASPSFRPSCQTSFRRAAPSRGRASSRRPARHTACFAQTAADLPGGLRSIVGAFQMVPDPMARYKQLLYFASKLEGLDDSLKIEINKVQGCVSQVWVVPELKEGKMYWRADSDAQLTKGLAALLVKGLNGCTPDEISKVEDNFIELLGLKQSLTPSRNNGFLNMFRLMQAQARAAQTTGTPRADPQAAATAADAAVTSDGAAAPPSDAPDRSRTGAAGSQARSQNGSQPSTSAWEPTPECPKPVAASIKRKVESELSAQEVIVLDESAQHAGHAGAKSTVSPSGETHLKLKVVSEKFEGLNAVKRHRLVYGLLQDELSGPVHALNLDTKTPNEVSQ